jgi:triacylglycerol esterase/lipase EstA (alpha/beta hydrolase family)
MIQHAQSGKYRARVWEYEGKWHVAIEGMGVDNTIWFPLGLDYKKGGWLSEGTEIVHFSFPDEASARRRAKELLAEVRASDARHRAPKVAYENADVIT